MTIARGRTARSAPVLRRLGQTLARREQGSVTVLILGLFVLVGILVLGAINVTAVHVSRNAVMDAADATSLHAANSLGDRGAYEQGLGATLPISDADVRRVAAEDLAQRERPQGVTEWHIEPGTGSPDGRTAVVVVRARVSIPIGSAFFEALGGQVDVRVVSSARSRTG